MAKRVASATEYTWDRVTKDSSTGPLVAKNKPKKAGIANQNSSSSSSYYNKPTIGSGSSGMGDLGGLGSPRGGLGVRLGGGSMGGGGKGDGAGGALSPGRSEFGSPNRMALSRLALDEDVGRFSGEADAAGAAGAGIPRAAAGATAAEVPSSLGRGAAGGGNNPMLSPVVRSNREVSTGRSVLRNSMQHNSGDPLSGTPFLAGRPSSVFVQAAAPDPHAPPSHETTTLRSEDHYLSGGMRSPRRSGSTAGDLGPISSLTSPSLSRLGSHVHDARGAHGGGHGGYGGHNQGGHGGGHGGHVSPYGGGGRDRAPQRSISGTMVMVPRPMPPRPANYSEKLVPISQLDRWRPQDEAAAAAMKSSPRRQMPPGTKGTGWSKDRLEQLTDPENGGSLRSEDPEDQAAKMLGLERELRVRRMRALQRMKHADVASAETFLSSWLSGRDAPSAGSQW